MKSDVVHHPLKIFKQMKNSIYCNRKILQVEFLKSHPADKSISQKLTDLSFVLRCHCKNETCVWGKFIEVRISCIVSKSILTEAYSPKEKFQTLSL